MLIRSQDKKALIDMNGLTIRIVTEEPFQHEPIAPYIEAYGTNSGDFSETLGTYSTKEKAIKVLDMIQDAYADYKTGEIIVNGIASSAHTGSYDFKESVVHGIAVMKGYGNEIRKSIVFQMPDDSEVEE